LTYFPNEKSGRIFSMGFWIDDAELQDFITRLAELLELSPEQAVRVTVEAELARYKLKCPSTTAFIP